MGANRNNKGGVTRVQQTHQPDRGVNHVMNRGVSHVTRVQPVHGTERSGSTPSNTATAQNKGKYYIIPNG